MLDQTTFSGQITKAKEKVMMTVKDMGFTTTSELFSHIGSSFKKVWTLIPSKKEGEAEQQVTTEAQFNEEKTEMVKRLRTEKPSHSPEDAKEIETKRNIISESITRMKEIAYGLTGNSNAIFEDDTSIVKTIIKVAVLTIPIDLLLAFGMMRFGLGTELGFGLGIAFAAGLAVLAPIWAIAEAIVNGEEDRLTTFRVKELDLKDFLHVSSGVKSAAKAYKGLFWLQVGSIIAIRLFIFFQAIQQPEYLILNVIGLFVTAVIVSICLVARAHTLQHASIYETKHVREWLKQQEIVRTAQKRIENLKNNAETKEVVFHAKCEGEISKFISSWTTKITKNNQEIETLTQIQSSLPQCKVEIEQAFIECANNALSEMPEEFTIDGPLNDSDILNQFLPLTIHVITLPEKVNIQLPSQEEIMREVKSSVATQQPTTQQRRIYHG